MDEPGSRESGYTGSADIATMREQVESREKIASERRKKGIAIVTALFLALFLFFSLAANMLLLVSAGAAGSEGGIAHVREKEIFPGGKSKIAMIPLEGVIMSKQQSSYADSGDMVARFREHIAKASSDINVKGVILEINSPGGSVTPSDIMYNEVIKFKKKNGSSKPIVTLMRDVTASGGYYVAAPSDWIVAHPTTICGSVGVYMGYMRLEKLFQKLGVEEELIKSGARKDMGSPFRQFTPEEKKIGEAMVAVVFDRFKAIVVKGRGDKVKGKMERIADGRVFIGEQAKEVGLVDEIGYLEDAVEKLKSLTGVANLSVVRYSTRVSLLESVIKDMSGHHALSLSELVEDNYAGLMYLWRPGFIN